MINKNYLVYFLNSLKEELNFKDGDDFFNKIHSDFNFRFKVQKFVYFAKYFGWSNSYNYNIYYHGPYSPELTIDYYSANLFEQPSSVIYGFQLDSFKHFIENKSRKYLEAASTILYFKSSQPNFSINEAIKKLGEIKPHISSSMVESAYKGVQDLKLIHNPVYYNQYVLDDIKSNLNKKILDTIKLFENFEINYNKVFISGSLDYLRIVLREENIEKSLKIDLFDNVNRYIEDVEKIYSLCDNDVVFFEKMNLNLLEGDFNRLQDYISYDLEILPRLDDDNFDDSLFY